MDEAEDPEVHVSSAKKHCFSVENGFRWFSFVKGRHRFLGHKAGLESHCACEAHANYQGNNPTMFLSVVMGKKEHPEYHPGWAIVYYVKGL